MLPALCILTLLSLFKKTGNNYRLSTKLSTPPNRRNWLFPLIALRPDRLRNGTLSRSSQGTVNCFTLPMFTNFTSLLPSTMRSVNIPYYRRIVAAS